MNSNNVTLLMYNYGQYSRPGTLANKSDFVWHQLGYMFEFGPLLSGEVLDSSGRPIRILDDGLWLVNQGSYSPDGSTKWGWLPRPGYGRAGSLTMPTVRDTSNWPYSWPAWPARDGTDRTDARNESYYRMDDFSNAKYPYYPFPSDSSQRGLGVSATVWTSQYLGGMQDAIVITWRLKNESPKNLPKCYFGFYGDPHVGGASDYGDDLASFIEDSGPPGDSRHYWSQNTISVYDLNGVGQYGIHTGYMSFKFLRTPENRDLTALSVLPYTNSVPNVPKNDLLFSTLLAADSIDRAQALFTTPGDNVLLFGTGPFSLNAGDSAEVELAIFFSQSRSDMLDDASYIHFASHWPSLPSMPGQSGGDPACEIHMANPQTGTLAGDTPVTWDFTGTDPTARVFLEYSSDGGNQWSFLASDLLPAGSFMWETGTVRDGARYLLRVVAYNSDFSKVAFSINDHYLVVDNPGNAQPEVKLISPAEGAIVRTSPTTVSWDVCDADNSLLDVRILDGTSLQGPFLEIHHGVYPNGIGGFSWDLSPASNSPSHYLKILVSDGLAESTYVRGSVAIEQQYGLYADSVFHHIAGKGMPTLKLQVTDSAQLTGDTYEVTFVAPFPDSAKVLAVRDLEQDRIVLSGFLIQPGVSTAAFDGVKLTVTDVIADLDTQRSGFTRPELNATVDFNWTNIFMSNRKKVAQDWVFAFNPLDTLPDGHYLFPGDTGLAATGKKVVIAPFRLTNLDSMAPARFYVYQPLGNDSLWQSGEPIILMPQGSTGSQNSYQVNLNFTPVLRPGAGDTLWVRTFRPITSADIYRFTTTNDFLVGAPSDPTPGSFSLENNFPNPFNPITTIEFELPRSGKVSLQVYDLLGRFVATVVQGEVMAGRHRRVFDATGLSSGVYFYRMTTEGFTKTRKLMLLR